MELRCPACSALLYSRRAKACGQCGAVLPSSLVLTDEKAQAQHESREWARHLADTLGADEARAKAPPAPTLPGLPRPTLTAVTATPKEIDALLNPPPDFAEQFRTRPRHSPWLYLVAAGLGVAGVAGLTFFMRGNMGNYVWLFLGGIILYKGFRAWRISSPLCPHCHQNIRSCAVVHCWGCGQGLRHNRCSGCDLDTGWTGILRPFQKGNTHPMAHCPGCGVYLDSGLYRQFNRRMGG